MHPPLRIEDARQDSRQHLEPLYGIRGIACLMVIVVHALLISGANQLTWLGPLILRFNVAVPIFFALSGFLLYRPFVVARHHEKARPSIRAYALHRVRRIVPAYWVALTLMIAIPGIATLNPTLMSVRTNHWWVFYGFMQTYWLRYAVEGIAQAWTLCVDTAFYVCLPLLVLLLDWAQSWRDGGREYLVLALIGAASAGLRVLMFAYPRLLVNPYEFQVTLGGTMLWFVCGMALATWNVTGRPSRRIARLATAPVCWSLAGFLLIGMAVSGLYPMTYAVPETTLAGAVEHITYALVASLALSPVVSPARTGGTLLRMMGSRPAVWLGRISYGTYLWHLVILAWLLNLGALTWLPGRPFVTLLLAGTVLSLVAGGLSYALIERPALHLWDRRRRPADHTITVG